jgi:hypothetical protein
LNSYDIVIADTSYVAVIGTAGETGTPFNYISSHNNGDGTQRIHVDMPATPIYGSLPVALTLLSAQTGKPVCLSVVSFSVLGAATPPSIPTPPAKDATIPVQPTYATSTTPGTTTVVAPIVTASVFQERLGRLCSGNGALDIWLLLITLYLLGVAVVALAEPSFSERNPALPASLILVPLVILIGFWYLTIACRAANWIPAILGVIAVIGLIVAYVEQKTEPVAIQLPAATKPVVPAAVPMVTVKRSVTQTLQVTTPQTKPKA